MGVPLPSRAPLLLVVVGAVGRSPLEDAAWRRSTCRRHLQPPPTVKPRAAGVTTPSAAISFSAPILRCLVYGAPGRLTGQIVSTLPLWALTRRGDKTPMLFDTHSSRSQSPVQGVKAEMKVKEDPGFIWCTCTVKGHLALCEIRPLMTLHFGKRAIKVL